MTIIVKISDNVYISYKSGMVKKKLEFYIYSFIIYSIYVSMQFGMIDDVC